MKNLSFILSLAISLPALADQQSTRMSRETYTLDPARQVQPPYTEEVHDEEIDSRAEVLAITVLASAVMVMLPLSVLGIFKVRDDIQKK